MARKSLIGVINLVLRNWNHRAYPLPYFTVKYSRGHGGYVVRICDIIDGKKYGARKILPMSLLQAHTPEIAVSMNLKLLSYGLSEGIKNLTGRSK